MKLSHPIVLSTVLTAFLAWPASALTFPIGSLRPDSIGDLGPHSPASRSYNEYWTYQLWLNGGIQIQLNISRANFGSIKDPACGSDLALMGFRGRNYFVAREYPATNLVFDPAKARLSIHQQIYFEGEPPKSHRVHFSTVKNGISYLLDLSFSGMHPGAVWGDGLFRMDGDQAGLFFHVPKATVKGRLAVNGDTLAVEGFGWMDHTYLTQYATKLMDVGYRYVVTSGRVEGGYFIMKGKGIFGYGLREENGKLALLRPKDLKALNIAPWGGVAMPGGLEFSFDNETATRFVRKENRQKVSAFQELNWFEKKGAKFLLGGEIIGYRGVGVVNDSLPAVFSFTWVRH